MAQAPSKLKKIDGDSHFFPPVNFTDVADILGVSQPALDRLLGDSTLFADREARRGGFKSSTAGQGLGAVSPTAATTQQGPTNPPLEELPIHVSLPFFLSFSSPHPPTPTKHSHTHSLKRIRWPTPRKTNSVLIIG